MTSEPKTRKALNRCSCVLVVLDVSEVLEEVDVVDVLAGQAIVPDETHLTMHLRRATHAAPWST